MKLSLPFLHTEWREVVDVWQLDSWEAYRDVARLGRKTRLPEKQRVALWEVFARIRAELKKAKLTTLGEIYGHLTADLAGGRPRPYDFVIADRGAGRERGPAPAPRSARGRSATLRINYQDDLRVERRCEPVLCHWA